MPFDQGSSSGNALAAASAVGPDPTRHWRTRAGASLRIAWSRAHAVAVVLRSACDAPSRSGTEYLAPARSVALRLALATLQAGRFPTARPDLYRGSPLAGNRSRRSSPLGDSNRQSPGGAVEGSPVSGLRSGAGGVCTPPCVAAYRQLRAGRFRPTTLMLILPAVGLAGKNGKLADLQS